MVKPNAALESFGMQQVALSPSLRLNEVHTMRGLLSLMWHGPEDAEQLVVCCPGAMGGLLGPGRGMFHGLGQELAGHGVATVCVDYRRPNDLESCILDTVSALDLAAQRGVTSAVAVGHSFGGAVAINVAAILSSAVAGVCTLATQSAGCESAGRIAPRPLLMIHGDRDDILPPFASYAVQQLAGGHGDVVIAEGEGHILVDNSGEIHRRVLDWTLATLGREPRG